MRASERTRAISEIESLLEAEEAPGATITIKVVEMTAEEFDALPEFGGY